MAFRSWVVRRPVTKGGKARRSGASSPASLRAYLGDAAGGPNVSPYAAASRATNLTNLPPTYIAVGSHEVFLDESVEYGLRLAHAGIPVEVHVYPRAFHGWDAIAPTAAISQRFATDRDQALKRALYPESSLPAV
jgi:acetyl esterase/lipase